MPKVHFAAAAAIALMLGATAPALAQSEEDAVRRADALANRADQAADGAAATDRSLLSTTGTKATEFTFTLKVPFTYNSNITFAETGRQGDYHGAPAAELSWKRETGDLVISVGGSAALDLYADRSAVNTSLISGTTSITWNTKSGISPYLRYNPTIIYGSGFTRHSVTLHNLVAGASRKFEFKAAERPASVTLDLNYTRREASVVTSEQNRVNGAAIFSIKMSSALSVSFRQNLSWRIYTGGTNKGRKDFNASSKLGLSWTVAPAVAFDFTVYFEANDSNRLTKDYQAWDIGPAIGFTAKF